MSEVVEGNLGDIEVIEGDREEVNRGSFRWAILDGDTVDLSKGTFLSKPKVPCRRVAISYLRKWQQEQRETRENSKPDLDGLMEELIDTPVFRLLMKRARDNDIHLDYLFMRALDKAVSGDTDLFERVIDKLFTIMPQSGDKQRRRGLANLARKYKMPDELIAIVLNIGEDDA